MERRRFSREFKVEAYGACALSQNVKGAPIRRAE
jgi:hypothetical protein